jgi:chromosome segregation protein
MDKGAHFFKCDFQVHSPRDLQWKGNEAITPDERKTYAEELTRGARQKNIHAIAVTDHHDFVFFPYIKASAKSELDDAGKPIPEHQRLIVFPGIEMTLTAPNCQALLILDADFPENLLASVLTALSITPSPPESSKQAQPRRISQEVVGDLSDLYKKLSTYEQLKGRFIVLPNVSETGYGTLLRSGFANFYKSMPCVGGYVDGSVTQFGTGNLSIINGQNRDYGFKSIAVFQTSDNRRRDHSDLGCHATWVKWSEPTAEALRQACLAKESRLSQSDPELPGVWISAISVSNSKFLSRVVLDFNQQYNAIIGGRGTGKSTLLEYLRWGLCDQARDIEDSELAPVQARRQKLIADTLLRYDGEVHVTLSINGVQHIVKRNSKTQEITLKIADGPFRHATEQEMRNLIPIQAYSQKQLSSIGVRIEELKRFVELPVKKELDQIRSNIRDLATELRAAYGNLIRKQTLDKQVGTYDVEIESLTRQLEGMRAGLTGLSPEDQAIIGQKPKYDSEQNIVDALRAELDNARDAVAALTTALPQSVPVRENHEDNLQNPGLIQQIEDHLATKLAELRNRAKELSGLLQPETTREIDGKLAEWEALKVAFETKYSAAKDAATVNQQQLDTIQENEKRKAELIRLQADNRKALASLANPEASYVELRAKWKSAHVNKVTTLDTQCQKFSSLSNGFIRAEVTKSIDNDLLRLKLRASFSGMNVRDQKVEELVKQVSDSADPMKTWDDIVDELESLSLHKNNGLPTLPSTPIMSTCGFIESEKNRIVNNFDSAKWLDLSTLELEFKPRFSYCTNQAKGEFIAFADASAGQQATALLTVLLNEQGAPLIIDQPEDDVDSKLVKDIIEQIWKAKKRRQLIFASHNANFVVNGDAELVVCCDYVKAGDQTGGQIKFAGAIDTKPIKDEITAVTEGGEDAFKLRRDKYGF